MCQLNTDRYLVSNDIYVVINILAYAYGTMIGTNWNVFLQNDLSERLQEAIQRTSMIYEGIKGCARFYGGKSMLMLQ
jgi:hypothetical protein